MTPSCRIMVLRYKWDVLKALTTRDRYELTLARLQVDFITNTCFCLHGNRSACEINTYDSSNEILLINDCFKNYVIQLVLFLLNKRTKNGHFRAHGKINNLILTVVFDYVTALLLDSYGAFYWDTSFTL